LTDLLVEGNVGDGNGNISLPYHDVTKIIVRFYWKVAQAIIVLTASVKEDARGGKPIASVCHVTPCSEHALFLHNWFLDFMFCFVCHVRWIPVTTAWSCDYIE
jgi:hypothetical protein